MTADYRDHLRAPDDPRLRPLQGADAITYAERMRENPRIAAILDDWKASFTSTPFSGITYGQGPVPDVAAAPEHAPTRHAVEAATRLLASCSKQERDAITHPFDSRIWRAWMNPEIYVHRYGVRLDETTDAVRGSVLRLMASSLSDAGYRRARSIMQINHHLGELVESNAVLNEFSYNVNVFGDPSASEPWGWQLYGHHLALNCAFVGDQIVLTPTFFGSEPTAVDHLTGKTGLFAPEEEAALTLVRSLTPAQKRRAVLYEKKRDPNLPVGRLHRADELNLAGAFQDNRLIENEGLTAPSMSSLQHELVLAIVSAMLAYQPEPARSKRLDEFTMHIEHTYFCWIGGQQDDDPFYFRVQNPTLLVELDHHAGVFLANSEPMRFHAHTVVRTPYGRDYGAALASAVTGRSYQLDTPN